MFLEGCQRHPERCRDSPTLRRMTACSSLSPRISVICWIFCSEAIATGGHNLPRLVPQERLYCGDRLCKVECLREVGQKMSSG